MPKIGGNAGNGRDADNKGSRGAAGSDTAPDGTRRSRLADYAELSPLPPGQTDDAREDDAPADATSADDGTRKVEEPARPAPHTTAPPTAPPGTQPPADTAAAAARLAAGRREFAALLGEFRRTPVLVPLAGEPSEPGHGNGDGDGDGHDGEDAGDAPVLTADLNGIRWIYAFSDEAALTRFALARGEGDRAWPYQRVLGARLLDVAVPAAGVPCGVALDAADGAAGGALFPPVRGVVPDVVAVDMAGVPGRDEGESDDASGRRRQGPEGQRPEPDHQGAEGGPR